jgi:Spy/CpxP family protein refolding chaperone
VKSNFVENFHPNPMKKITLTALTAALCSISLIGAIAAASFAQQSTKTPATSNGNVSQEQAIEQLKLTKDQQAKLVKLRQTVMEQQISVLTPSQKEQLRLARQQGKSPDLTLTADQQTQLKAIQSAAIAKQNTILTPEQQKKLQEMNKQNAAPQK